MNCKVYLAPCGGCEGPNGRLGPTAAGCPNAVAVLDSADPEFHGEPWFDVRPSSAPVADSYSITRQHSRAWIRCDRRHLFRRDRSIGEPMVRMQEVKPMVHDTICGSICFCSDVVETYQTCDCTWLPRTQRATLTEHPPIGCTLAPSCSLYG